MNWKKKQKTWPAYKDNIINLKQKKGLFVNVPVYILHNGKMGLDRSFIQDDWVFRGWSGFSCDYQHSGLKRVLTLHSTLSHQAYTSKNFEHMIYSLSLKSSESCAVSGDKQGELLTTLEIQSRIKFSSVWTLPKYAEMFIVDNKWFQVIVLPRLLSW